MQSELQDHAKYLHRPESVQNNSQCFFIAISLSPVDWLFAMTSVSYKP